MQQRRVARTPQRGIHHARCHPAGQRRPALVGDQRAETLGGAALLRRGGCAGTHDADDARGHARLTRPQRVRSTIT